MFQKVSMLVLSCFICGSLHAEQEKLDEEMVQEFFLNVKASHNRGDNQYPFGSKNSSMVVFNPYIGIGDFVLDADFSYGRSTKYVGFLGSAKCMSRITGNLPDFFDNYYSSKKGEDWIIYPKVSPSLQNTVYKPHFYRSYTRVIFNDRAHDIKIIVGDVATRNTIGFQTPFSGGGINIARQGGNGNVINPGLPLVITKLSKVEVRLGNEILRVCILPPGTYTVDDLGEEAKLPGVTVKVSDQLSRSETFTVDYFSGYDMPDFGTDDFDITIAFTHYWKVDDPYKIRYRSKPRFSGNYRFTPIENVTFAFGAQTNKDFCGLDFNVIFMTPLGKISPNIGFSNVYQGKRAIGAGLYYALPENQYGIHLEALIGAKERGYGDLGIFDEKSEDYDEYMGRYFADLNENLRKGLLNGASSPQGSRFAMVRLYFDPIWGFTPGFTFRGDWANDKDKNTRNYRDYSASLTKSFFNKRCMMTAVAGITYDDPDGGRNQKSPDKRLTLAFSIDLDPQVSIKGTYSHLDQERMKKYASIAFTPEAIKGLEIQGEYFRMPGRSTPVFSIRYDNEYFGMKFEESIASSYDDKGSGTIDGHKNNQTIMFGTSLTPQGFSSVKNNNFNIIRMAEDFKK